MNRVAKEVVENVIGGNTYLHSKVNNWSNTIVEHVLSQLVKQSKNFKFIGKKIVFIRLHFVNESYTLPF